MFFWLVSFLLVALTLFFFWRAWSRGISSPLENTISEKALYERRLAEIDLEFEAGKIDATNMEAAKAEAGRQLIRSTKSGEKSSQASVQQRGWVFILALVFIPVFTLAIYPLLGSPQLINPPERKAQNQEQSLEQLVATVERRLQESPDDAQGWRVLAPIYVRSQQYEKAEAAFRNLLRIEGESSIVMSSLAEMITAKQQGKINAEALQLFERAVVLDARNTTARFFLGLEKIQSGNEQAAREIWQKMVDDAEGDEDWLPAIKERLASLEETASQSTNTQQPSAIEQMSEEDRSRVEGMVASLEQRLEDDPTDQRGWVMLVRSYIVLGDMDRAKAMAEKAVTNFSDQPEFSKLLEQMISNGKPDPNSGSASNERNMQ